MSLFDTLELQPADPILGIPPLYKADPRPKKINLSVGIYQNEKGETPVLDVVRKAEALIAAEKSDKNYLPITGDPLYCKEVEYLLYGAQHSVIEEKRVATVQAIGGSGALRLGAELLRRMGVELIAICDPSWTNHAQLMRNGGLTVSTYPYYDPKNKGLDFAAMIRALEQLPKNSAVLLHTCCHNPTGIDPSPEQWKILSTLFKRRGLIPFFDSAYQGFKTNLEEDVYPVRLFSQEGHRLLTAYSFAKNMGLYGERAGALSCVTRNANSTEIIYSHLKILIRSSYSSPPIHTAAIVRTVLSDPALSKEWSGEVDVMRKRIDMIRDSLVTKLSSLPFGSEFTFLNNQSGMFSYTGLSKEQVQKMRDDHAIYMLSSGRINVSALNKSNMEDFIRAIVSVRKGE